MNRLLACCLGILSLQLGCSKCQPTSTSAPSASASGSARSAPKNAGKPGAKHEFGFFTPVAVGEDITIYPMGGSAIVDTGAFYAVLGDGAVKQDPHIFRTSIEKEPGKVLVTATERFTGFFGAYPDQAWATGANGLMKLVNELWTKQDILREGEKLLDLAPWENGRAIVAIRMKEADIRFTLAGSAAGGVVPAPGKPTAAQAGCAVRMDPDAPVKLAGLPSGHLFAVGTECKTGKPIVERWAPSKVRGDVDVIEGVSGVAAAIAVVSADEAYAFFAEGNKGHLATWDGKTWKGRKTMFGAAKSTWVAEDGEVWVLGEAGLFEHPKGKADLWDEIEIGVAKPTSAWAKDTKTVWVVADKKTLLRSGPRSKRPIRLPLLREVQEMLTTDRRWLASEACRRVYVQLAAIGPADNVPTTFPALTDAVRTNPALAANEIEYVVEDVGGTLHAGAKVPNLAIAEKLITAFRAGQPSSKPRVYCHEPVVKGTLKVQ